MLMDANAGAVDHLQVAIISLCDGLENPIPDTNLAPAPETIAAGRWRAIALGDVTPGRSRAQTPIDAVQHLAIIRPRHAAWLVRQKRFDDRPLQISQFVTACVHQGSSPEA